MAARGALYSLLEADLAPGGGLGQLGFTSVYAAESVDTPDDDLFITIRWESSDNAFGRTGPRTVAIWVHTRDLDYGDLDRALERVKTLVLDAIHVPGEDGWILTAAKMQGTSRDLKDEGFGTLARYVEFDVVSRYAST